MNKTVAVSVMSDFVTDQRVIKECRFMFEKGYHVVVFCLKSPHGISHDFPFEIKPLRVWAKKGVWFFLSYNLLLLPRLMKVNADVYWANDLDTLLPNVLVSSTKKKKLVYDSHELYTEQPSLSGRSFKRKIWERVEAFCVPRVKYFITVNSSIAQWYQEKYKIPVSVVMNMPLLGVTNGIVPHSSIAPGKKRIVLQGSGLHHGRGGAEAVEAMRFLEEEYVLLIIGSGDALPALHLLVEKYNLGQKVVFLPRMPYAEMMRYTKMCHLGLHLDSIELGMAGMYSSPNKLFDYIHAGVPVLATRGVEIVKVISEYKVGYFLEKVDPLVIAEAVKGIFSAEELRLQYTQNTTKARTELCWEQQLLALNQLWDNMERGL